MGYFLGHIKHCPHLWKMVPVVFKVVEYNLLRTFALAQDVIPSGDDLMGMLRGVGSDGLEPPV